MIMPFRCPTCHGHGTVSKPHWIVGDTQTWVSLRTELYPCPSCNGTGVIWTEIQTDSTYFTPNGGQL